jgi:hypothetical protein
MSKYVVTDNGLKIHIQGDASSKTVCGTVSAHEASPKELKLALCEKCAKILYRMK